MRFVVFLLAGLVALHTPAAAARIETDPDNSSVLRISGKIDDLSATAFKRALARAGGITTIALDSDGGSVRFALLIAKEINDRGLGTIVPRRAVCASACAYIFLAGKTRTVRGRFGVGTIADAPDAGSAQANLSDIRQALERYDVRQDVITKMLQPQPETIRYFTRKELRTLDVVKMREMPVEKQWSERLLPELAVKASDLEARVLFYEDVPGSSSPDITEGKVTWSDPPANHSPVTSVIGEAVIPAKDLEATVVFRRNEGAMDFTGYSIDISFVYTSAPPGERISEVLQVALKTTLPERGDALVGASFMKTDRQFRVALDGSTEAESRNVDLLAKRNWMDIPLTYQSGRRALLTLEKSPAAIQLFERLLVR